jgi:Ca2+-binding RTX toxin-like protein
LIALAPSVTQRALISTGSGPDTIYGGAGNDTVWAHKGDDLIYANAGKDTVYGLSGNDTIWGGPGNDNLSGGNDRNKVEEGGSLVAGPVGGSTSGGVVKPEPEPEPKPEPTPVPKPTTPEPDPAPVDSGGPTNVAAPVPVITATTTRTFEAGHAFHAQALSSVLKVGTPLTARYHWNFGDPDGRFNTLEGFNAAHFYEKPGTYTVRLTVTNAGGRSASVTTTLNVKESTRRKVYVSESGSDSNDGSSPSRAIRTAAKAGSMLRDNTEILFRRGDTFDQYSTLRLRSSNVVVGAYGSGARPILNYKGKFAHAAMISTGDGTEMTVQDLTFDTEHDLYNSDGDAPRGFVAGEKTNSTLRNCLFFDLGYAISTAPRPQALLVLDNAAPDPESVRSYFAWVEGSDHVYLGNHAANVRGHILRIGGANRVNITGNDFTNLVEGGDGGTIRGTLTLHTGEYLYVARNKLNQSKVTLGPLTTDKTADQRYKTVVFEGNEFNSVLKLDDGIEGVMLRNNVFRVDGSYAIEIASYNRTYERGVKDVTIVNNTSVDMEEHGNFIKHVGQADGIVVANNLFHAPNLKTGPHANGAVRVIDATGTLRSFKLFANNVWGDPYTKPSAHGGVIYVAPDFPMDGGYKTAAQWNAMPQVATDHFVNTKLGSGWRPDEDSVAASAAARFAGVFTDMNGKLRPLSGRWSAGAIQV